MLAAFCQAPPRPSSKMEIQINCGHNFPLGMRFSKLDSRSHAATPKGNLFTEAGSDFQKQHRLQSVNLQRLNHRLKSMLLPRSRNSRETNSARRFTPNLTKIFRKWNLIVCSLTCSRAPISAFVNPCAQHSATCASRRLKLRRLTIRFTGAANDAKPCSFSTPLG
jgi:hypothetical protein